MAFVVEPRTGVSFPVKLDDRNQLNCVGVKRKSLLGMGVNIYAYGIYADNEKLKDLLKSKIGTAPAKPTKEMYDVAIDSDVPMMTRMVIVFANASMKMAKKGFAEDIGASIKKLNGGKKNDELSKMVMGAASDEIKLKPGSVIEISRLPGYVIQTKVLDEVVSKVESELLSKAIIHQYLAEDDIDKEAKEKFGMSLLSLF